jgi:hypothetical protein
VAGIANRKDLTFDPGLGFRVRVMGGYKISEAARATGFTESALRFYEQEGVVVPEPTETGYRSDSGLVADLLFP